MAYNAEDFAREADVSRETLADFEAWYRLLIKWNRKINLVSSAATDGFWERHALDSWQVWAHVPEDTSKILDLGSGGGFPGLAMAMGVKQRGAGRVTLVESAGKKANFLRAVIRELDLPATVWGDRVEDLPVETYDVISARAFAPLPRMFTYAQKHWGGDTIGLFLKGRGVIEELTESRKCWTYDVTSIPSRSDETGVLLKVQGLAPKP